ncbi:MAG: ABC transporter ATP-binding protein [Clostridia bacterium]|nr:ABC transporter ATP-binding protein [Clostridia bacterium]
MEKAITLENVTLSYGGKSVVQDVSLCVYKGENLCLVGANGSGKSTLLKACVGLLKPDKGTIKMEKGLRVAYMQQTHLAERDFPATVWEIVLSGTQIPGRFRPFYTRADKQKAMETAKLLKIEGFLKKQIGALSGGQQQRVLLARALAADPDLLVLDEPCSALDPHITHELHGIFDDLREKLGITMLISTHCWDYVAHSADRVLEMDAKVVYLGPTEQWPRIGEARGEEACTCSH